MRRRRRQTFAGHGRACSKGDRTLVPVPHPATASRRRAATGADAPRARAKRARTARSLLGPAVFLAVIPLAAADPIPGLGVTHGGEPSAPVVTPMRAEPETATPVPAAPADPEAPALGVAARRASLDAAGAVAGPGPFTRRHAAYEPLRTAAFSPSALPPAAPDLDIAMELRIFVPELPGASEPVRPIPDMPDADPEKVALGRALFHDPRLSKDGTISCASCHELSDGGDDGRRVSIGVEGQPGVINSPTVFNVGLNFRQFWDGRADSLEQQIDDPVQSPIEMGSLWPDIVVKLYQDESYPGMFEAVYPDGINRENIKDALAEFMRSLVTPNSRFDRWLKGEEDALDAREKRGYALFKHYGCASCHQGANVGGNMFQVFGVLNEYFKKRGDIVEADLGRFNVTGNPVDRHAFKVPSLRMAAHTAPYLHDGSAATLRDAVDAMFEFQLGREAPGEDKDAIVAFIETLAGENEELLP